MFIFLLSGICFGFVLLVERGVLPVKSTIEVMSFNVQEIRCASGIKCMNRNISYHKG